jgi:transcriptional regulator of acetoin/glycerol metabolism
MIEPTQAIEPPHANQRLASIEQARKALLVAQGAALGGWLSPWIERSWQRCLADGLQPHNGAQFDVISAAHMHRTTEANVQLVQLAKPLLDHLGRAIVNTRYFAILTNSDGVVVDFSGAIDHSDPRAHLITRIGTDLSERAVGTTAISTALMERQPVWLHRGEHFFDNTAHYSCAGAPVMGPDGQCVGMIDLTGIDAQERPELKHLVAQTALKIENALVLAQAHTLTLRLNWPGNALGSDSDGLLCLDEDGWVASANPVARQMVPALYGPTVRPIHVSEVFGMPYQMLFDAARRDHTVLEVPLWSGLRLQAMPVTRALENQSTALRPPHSPTQGLPLRELETALIRKAVDDARGNVALAAKNLGIGRATVYRKLGQKLGDKS